MNDQKSKAQIIKKINILKGQLNGISKMIEDNKSCLDIVHQIKAIKNGLNKVGEDMVKSRLINLVNDSEESEEIQKLLSCLSKY